MKNKRQIFITTLTVLVSVFFVAGVVKATTTVGLGIVNNSTTSAIGVDLNGAYTTSALQIGTTGDRLTFAAADDHAVDVWSTNAIATAATVRSFELNQVHTGAGVSRAEALTSILTSNVALGSWANAIFGKIDFSTSGEVAGLAGVIAAELTLPGSDSASSGGEYTVFEAEINCPANCDMGLRPVHVLEVNVWGDAAAQIDTVGYLVDLDGLTSGAGKFWNDSTVRMKIADTAKYLVMSDTENKLDLGDGSAGIDVGTATTGLALTGTQTSGIDMSGGTITTDLTLSNGGTIHNTSTDVLTITEATTAFVSDLTVAGNIDVTEAALASGAYNSAVKSVSTLVTTGTSEGIAGYFEAHLDGTYASKLLYGFGAWTNIDANAILTGGTVRALDVGIWANDASITATSTEFVGINIDMHFDISDDAATLYPLRFNTTQAGANPDGMFRAANHEAIASTVGAGVYSTADGYISVNISGTDYRMPYYLAVD